MHADLFSDHSVRTVERAVYRGLDLLDFGDAGVVGTVLNDAGAPSAEIRQVGSELSRFYGCGGDFDWRAEDAGLGDDLVS